MDPISTLSSTVEPDATSDNTEVRALETESSPGFDIAFDFSLDTNGFFDDPARRDTLEAAAEIWEGIILDEFTDLPAGTLLSFTNPQTGEPEQFESDFAIDDLVIFVGAMNQTGGALAMGGPSAIFAVGSDLDERFNGPDFEPWVGVISFEPDVPWFFDPTPATDDDIPANENDFLTTALHEIGHVLGFGTSGAFADLIDGGSLAGAETVALNGGDSAPLFPDLAHFAEGLESDGQETLMDPTVTIGTRKLPTPLDVSALADIGFEVAVVDGGGGDTFETIVVDTLLDEADGSVTDGDASLRDALALVAEGGTINFADGLTGTITLNGTELTIDRAVTINGSGIAVDADNQSRVFNIDDGDGATFAGVSLFDLTIMGGNAAEPGGGIANSENLLLASSTVTGNLTQASGGAIANYGGATLSVTNSTISGSSAIASGGGIVSYGGATLSITNSTISSNTADIVGGGLENLNGTVEIANSTISDNTAAIGGGGLENASGTVAIANSTISGNVADEGGGVFNYDGGQLSIISTIAANNTVTSGNADVANAAANPGPISVSFSLIEDGAITEDLGNNITGADPLLAPAGLQDNGGPTQTIALLAGSPAIDAGDNPNGLANDQRGEPREIGAAPDIGAFEVDDPDAPGINLDVDGFGGFDPFVDALNIFRVAAGAPQAVVVTAEAAAGGVTQQAIVDAVGALGLDDPQTPLNVDNVAGFDPFVDALNIFRVAAGAPQAVVVTAEAAAGGGTQQTIVDATNALLA